MMRLVAIAVVVLLTACDTAKEVKTVLSEAASAQQELRQTVGHGASVNLKQQPDETYVATVTFDRMPEGISSEALERNVNLILRKHVHKVERVDLIVRQ